MYYNAHFIQLKGTNHSTLEDGILLNHSVYNTIGSGVTKIPNDKVIIAIADGVGGNAYGDLASRFVLSKYIDPTFNWRSLKLNKRYLTSDDGYILHPDQGLYDNGIYAGTDKEDIACRITRGDTNQPLFDPSLSDQEISDYNLAQIEKYSRKVQDELIAFGNGLEKTFEPDPEFKIAHILDHTLASCVTILIKVYDQFYLVHAGNTRAYALKGSEIILLSHDQSDYQAAIDRNDEEAMSYTPKNGLYSSFGNGTTKTFLPIFKDVSQQVKDFDKIFLTTDGIHDHLTKDQTDHRFFKKALIEDQLSDEEFLRCSCDKAIENRSYDDLSALIVDHTPCS